MVFLGEGSLASATIETVRSLHVVALDEIQKVHRPGRRGVQIEL